jgi:hypothetical protein
VLAVLLVSMALVALVVLLALVVLFAVVAVAVDTPGSTMTALPMLALLTTLSPRPDWRGAALPALRSVCEPDAWKEGGGVVGGAGRWPISGMPGRKEGVASALSIPPPEGALVALMFFELPR